MANDLNLLKSFVDGQGVGAANYFTYPEDFDTNFTDIENGFNQLNAEVKAFAGQNAILVQDLITSTSPSVTAGWLDSNSFGLSFITGNTQVQIGPGTAFAGGSRIDNTTTDTFTGSGAAGTRFFALALNGTITQETVSNQAEMDLYSVNWNGSTFDTGTLVRLPDGEAIMPAGDDFQNQRIAEGDGGSGEAGIPAFTYDRIADRLTDIDRIMRGVTTSADSGQSALGRIAVSGSVTAPGIITGDGTNFEAATGLYRPAADQLGVSVDGIAALIWLEVVANEPQSLFRNGTTLARPPIGFQSDTDTGFGWVSDGVFRAIADTLEVCRFVEAGGVAQLQLISGSDASPPLSVAGDADTGFRLPGSDVAAVITGGVRAQEWNASQQRNSATQGRASATNAAFTVPNNAVTAVDLTTEQYDQGTYHDNVTNPDRFTVPSGHDGNFSVKATGTFVANATGQRGIQITLNGTPVAEGRCDAAAAGTTAFSVAIDLDLVATDIVRMTAFQDSGGNLDVNARLTIRHED